MRAQPRPGARKGRLLLVLVGLLAPVLPARAATGIPLRPDPPAVCVRLAPGGQAPLRLVPYGQASRTTPATASLAAGPWGVALAAEAPFADLGLSPDEPLARTLRLPLRPGVEPHAAAAALRKEPGVESAWVEGRFRVAWADAERHLAATPSPVGDRLRGVDPGFVGGPDDPSFVDGSQWGLRNEGTGPYGGVAGADLRAEAGWAVTTGSTAVRVAIVDTGADLEHPELAGPLADGSPRLALAYNSSIEGDGGSPWDSVGHGTIVSGVAVARSNNGALLDGRGVAGVAGGAGGDSAGCVVLSIKATPTRLLDALGTELSKGIIYAASNGARVINLSFGSDDDDENVRDAISYAQRRGCVVVCGAGNGQDARPQYPGYYARRGAGVSVAALVPDGTLAAFSSRGPQIDVAAPGQDIWGSYMRYENAYQSPVRNFHRASGTSFAAPHVSGLAALATALQPSLTDNEFQQLLRHTARDVGTPGRDDTYGWGVADAGALLSFVAPPRGFLRGTASAQEWTLLGTDSVTLRETRLAVGGCGIDGRYVAERWEVRGRVHLPPGHFLETPVGIVRTHGSRGWDTGPLLEYDLGWGEVVPGSASPDGFTLRTYVYHVTDAPVACGGGGASGVPIGYVPVRPENVVFAWSAFGRVDVPLAITSPAADGRPWTVDTADTLRWEVSPRVEVTGFVIELSWDSGRTWHRRTVDPLPATTREFALAAPCAVPGEVTFVRIRALRPPGSPAAFLATRSLVPARPCASGENGWLRVTSPLVDGAPWPVESSDSLRWETSVAETVREFLVDVSWDSGRTWQRRTETALPAHARAHALAAPCAVAGESTFVRVTALDLAGVSDIGIARRRIAPARDCASGEHPSVRFVAPALDGAPWSVDVADSLRWEAREPLAVLGFHIDTSADSGRTWRRQTTDPLSRETRAFAYRAWCAPAGEITIVRLTALEVRGGIPVHSVVERRITAAHPCPPDDPPGLRITVPATDGATWPVDVPGMLHWEVSDPRPSDVFHVDVTTDSARTWRRLTEPALPRNARSYAFAAPCAPESGSTLVRVILVDSRDGAPVEVAARRRIVPVRDCVGGEAGPVQITFPGEDGADWPVDSADSLRWTLDDDAPPTSGFLVDLSWDSGRTWRRLTPTTLPAATRAYALAAPCAVAGERTIVRVIAVDARGGIAPENVAWRELDPVRGCSDGETPDGGTAFAFLPVAPNPARGTITFRYVASVPAAATARGGSATTLGSVMVPIEELVIHDARGRRVRRFASLPDGALVWDGRDESGARVPSGVYFARLTLGIDVATRRFVLLASP